MINVHAHRVTDSLTQYSQQESSFEKEKRVLARKLNRPELESLEFNRHEMSIALDVICPDDLKTSFSDVGGMEKEIDVIMDNVILPFKFWREEFNRSKEQHGRCLQGKEGGGAVAAVTEVDMGSIECHVPGGMLMYGRPGTGKVSNFNYHRLEHHE